MRKIEQQMIAAIKADKNWSSGNTQVVTNDGVSTVYLHGNKIALVDDTTMTIFDGGWQSNTTKSRLNALCSEFCIAGEGVFQQIPIIMVEVEVTAHIYIHVLENV